MLCQPASFHFAGAFVRYLFYLVTGNIDLDNREGDIVLVSLLAVIPGVCFTPLRDFLTNSLLALLKALNFVQNVIVTALNSFQILFTGLGEILVLNKLYFYIPTDTSVVLGFRTSM